MSFLNPVNEPVKRFSSTDAGAPQINYNARVAGDVKAVLKACLVTGYGAKASAGWTITNEVAHVCRFISPSTAMSDYRIAINDTSTASTAWTYYYQNKLTTPTNNILTKDFSFMDKGSGSNGWELIVTGRGIYFVEILVNPYNNKRMARITHWGQVKSALISNTGQNIGFWQAGVAATNFTNEFYGLPAEKYYSVNGVRYAAFSSANISSLNNANHSYGQSNVDISSELYIYAPPTTGVDTSILVGQQVGLLVKTVAQEIDLYGVYDDAVGGRPVLKVCVGRNEARGEYLTQYCSVMLIYLDNWEY